MLKTVKNADYIVTYDDVSKDAKLYSKWYGELDKNGDDLPLDTVHVTPELQARLDATGRTIFDSMFDSAADEEQRADEEWADTEYMYS